MCGIYGIFDRSGNAEHSTLATMRESLHHRGPDDTGWLDWSPDQEVTRGRGTAGRRPAVALLGHNRLSIIDLSEGGWQPMSSNDSRFHLTFNGEIYNYLELRAELERDYEFHSNSDTEVLLAAWHHWGTGCLSRLVGMFAFAMLDTVEQRCYLVRDPFGIKPLFYIERRDRLSVSSEIPALLAAGLSARRIAPGPLYDFLRHGQVDHRPETMIDDIRRLPPGHRASFDLRPGGGALRIESYWTLPAEREEMPFEEVVSTLSAGFRRSIELHVRSDVPVGVALSGGIDSSAIACTMREVLGPDAEIHAFGYLADDPRLDEERWIDLVGAACGAVVHKIRVTPDELLDDVDDLLLSQGEPFGSTSIYAQRRVFEAARLAGVTVLLDGQGADELFGGYRNHLASAFAGLVRAGHLLSAGRLAANVSRRADVAISRDVVVRTLAGTLPRRASERLLCAAGLGPFPPWLDAGWFEARGVRSGALSAPGSLDEALGVAFSSTSLPSLLRFEDRNSMRFSLESRVPFLEQQLVDSVFRFPRSSIIGEDGLTKYALREALAGVVPSEVLARRDKIGFTTPDRWFESIAPWVEGVLLSESMGRVPGLVRRACLDDWHAIRSGARPFDWRVWRWVNVARWADLLDLRAL